MGCIAQTMTDPTQPQPAPDPDREIGDLPSLAPQSFRMSPPERLLRKAPVDEKPSKVDEPAQVVEPQPEAAPQEAPSPGENETAAAPEPAKKRTSLKTPSAGPLPAPEMVPALESIPGEADLPAGAPANDEFTSPSPRPNTPKSRENATGGLTAAERMWMALLVVGVLAVGGAAFWFLRGGLPAKDASLPQLNPAMPASGDRITIEKITAGWTRTSAPSPRGAAMVPRLGITISPASHGALRLFFKDERGQAVGDTMNLTVRDGKFTTGTSSNLLFCTDGLRSDLDFSDLRSRSDKFWTVEILEGPTTMDKRSEFRPLLHLSIPWDLADEPAAN